VKTSDAECMVEPPSYVDNYTMSPLTLQELASVVMMTPLGTKIHSIKSFKDTGTLQYLTI